MQMKLDLQTEIAELGYGVPEMPDKVLSHKI